MSEVACFLLSIFRHRNKTCSTYLSENIEKKKNENSEMVGSTTAIVDAPWVHAQVIQRIRVCRQRLRVHRQCLHLHIQRVATTHLLGLFAHIAYGNTCARAILQTNKKWYPWANYSIFLDRLVSLYTMDILIRPQSVFCFCFFNAISLPLKWSRG